MAREREKKIELKGDEVQLVSFELGDETFAVDVSQVREIVRLERITGLPSMPDFIEGVVNLRGQITTVLDLKKRFSMGEVERGPQARIIIGEVESLQFGIMVDSVSEVIRVSPENIVPPPKILTGNIDSGYLKGICKLPDTLIMLLDMNTILSEEDIVQIDRATEDIPEKGDRSISLDETSEKEEG